MSLAILHNKVVAGSDPGPVTTFEYTPDTGRVSIHTAGEDGVTADLDTLIMALKTIKTTMDNEHLRDLGRQRANRRRN